jgi:DNA-binding NarL/FixJ family response regulator
VAGSARTEAEAILWLTDHPGGWDLAVLDLVLDQGTGMGVIVHAKRSPSPGKVIVFSDYASPGIEQHCLRLGADAVIAKGDIAALIAYCREMIST